MDALILSRIQFALNMSFHILFPTISIALCWVLLFFRHRWVKTREQSWLTAYRFWTKVFALTFALGVVSGITMSFQFGTNWPGYMERVGNIAGPLLGYEVLTAFFLEATFLGVMLFGHNRVSERVHLFATFMVAFGTTLSAFWILALNSWMQTPQGYWVDPQGIYHVASWIEVIFNPSFPYRFVHMVTASFLTVAFLLCGLSAWQVIKKTADEATPKVLKTGLILAAILIPIQIFVGDQHGLNTLHHQPEKIAAIEGIWHTEKGAPLLAFAWPNKDTQTNDYAIEIPKGASLILTHELNGELKGLNEFEVHPPVAPLFFGFRIMVAVGMLMLAASWFGVYQLRRTKGDVLKFPRYFLYGLASMTFAGWLATLAGWYVTEIGRQPWIVHGLIKLSEIVTHTPPANIAFTLTMYVVVYLALIISYVGVLKYMAEHPKKTEAEPTAESGEAIAIVANEAIDSTSGEQK
ncbi:cytochrome ubiquinol oxidase subunit I [Aquirhabdus parva]|uniref:Cytochrome ubiquinol oxidase subunit I n=1 Tax=Aquirhabdus parva TaxID=2283318 RepID=A0A345P7R7_9GAMM|nr:cytochrome ubiquinol oxidase subunit I [Aquirhabdus parva]AXI03326.1 cytochrome ubiquinol oxidase subunit I [Aquirhabdus parva]